MDAHRVCKVRLRPISTYIRTSHVVCELIVSSPHPDVRISQNVRIRTGDNEFASEMRSANVSGNGPLGFV